MSLAYEYVQQHPCTLLCIHLSRACTTQSIAASSIMQFTPDYWSFDCTWMKWNTNAPHLSTLGLASSDEPLGKMQEVHFD